MVELSPEQKLYALERFAQFATPTQVQKEIKAQWGVEATLQALQAYDPKTLAGKRMSEAHKAHFDAARAAFHASREHIGVCHPAYRAQKIQDLLDDPMHGKNPFLVKDLLQMAERIEGGQFKQRQNGIPVAEVNAHIAEQWQGVRKTVAAVIPDPTLRENVLTTIDEQLEGRSRQSSV